MENLVHYLVVFFMSMVPIIELRGSVLYFWGIIESGTPLNIWICYVLAIVGNMLPVPLIFFFARAVLEWGASKKFIGKFFSWCLKKGHNGGEKLQAKAGKGLFWALMLFVGIPLPGTGAWTGTLAASLLDMDFKTSVKAVMLGVVIAGVIMSVVGALGFGAIFSVI